MNWEKFQNAYIISSQSVKNLIDSNSISDLVDALVKNKVVDEKLKPSLLVIIPNYLVNVINDIELGKLLLEAGLDFNTSHKIYTEIQNLVNNLDRSILTSGLSEEIAEMENVAQSLESVRTMPKDMERVQYDTPVHQSSQDNLLQPTTQSPARPTSETPRWDTQ